MRVAGVWIIPSSCARSVSSEGSSDSALIPSAIKRLGAERPAEDHETIVGLGEFDGGLRHGHRVPRPRKRGRSLQQRRDAVETGAVEGEGGQPVLRDLEGRARTAHASSQISHLGHRQTRHCGSRGPWRSRRTRRPGGDELPLLRTVHARLRRWPTRRRPLRPVAQFRNAGERRHPVRLSSGKRKAEPSTPPRDHARDTEDLVPAPRLPAARGLRGPHQAPIRGTWGLGQVERAWAPSCPHVPAPGRAYLVGS